MSKIGDWYIGIEQKHYADQCEKDCQLCKDRMYQSEPNGYDEGVSS